MSQSFWQIMSGVRAVELIHTSLLSTSEEGVIALFSTAEMVVRRKSQGKGLSLQKG